MSQRGGDNDVLHACLLRGALTVQVTDMDIRRTTDAASSVLPDSLYPIETDYILQVQSTKPELEAYSCSKRFVDLRELAGAMRERAVEIIKYYEGKKDAASQQGGRTSLFGSSGGSGRGTILGGLEKALAKPAKFAEIISNCEPRSSNLVSELDSIFRDKKQDESGGEEGRKMKRRTSEYLNQGAPKFVREIMVGVDEFYEAIFSEKRQFGGKKTNYDHVKSVAERRKKLIDSAFSSMVHALSSADLATVSKRHPDSIPGSLDILVKSLENFLLTDVVEEEGVEKAVPQDAEAIGNSAVCPVSKRRRASVVERETEVKQCQEVAELVMSQSADEQEDDKEIAEATPAEGRVETKVPIVAPSGLLPENPIDFGIIVAVGAILFKLLEGRVLNVHIDMLLVFGTGCGLLGYQLGRPSVVYVEKSAANGGTQSKKKHVTIQQTSPSKEKGQTGPERPQLNRRTLLTKSKGSLNIERDRKSLIQASLQSVRNIAVKQLGLEAEDEKPIVPAKTFDKFPDGAAIGSHLNCWSQPPSSNFHVRGPNYLKDKKKVPSGEFLFPSRGCDLFITDNPPANMGRHRSILNGKLRDVPTFIINYRLPWGVFLSYHEIPDRFLPFLRRGHGHGDLTTPLPSIEDMPAGERAMCNFLLSDSDEKNEVWKIVPVVVEGPWVVKRVVGGKPAIVGTKMPISYVYQPPEKGLAEYLEADLDIVSSAAARNILAVVRSYTQTLTIDLGYVVQGNKKEELPEQMMLGMRLHGLNPLTAELMPDFDDQTHIPELESDASGYDTE